MYPRTNYEMSEEDFKAILEACKPTVYMLAGSVMPPSPQENANRAWESLGKRMGFDYMTVRPIPGKSGRFFSAVPSETETERLERIEREKEELRQKEIERLTFEIQERQEHLKKLTETNRPDPKGEQT